MKKDSWKTILQIAIRILTAIATTLGVTSCMGERTWSLFYYYKQTHP